MKKNFKARPEKNQIDTAYIKIGCVCQKVFLCLLLPDSQGRIGLCGRYSIISLSDLEQVPCLQQDISTESRTLHACSL